MAANSSFSGQDAPEENSAQGDPLNMEITDFELLSEIKTEAIDCRRAKPTSVCSSPTADDPLDSDSSFRILDYIDDEPNDQSATTAASTTPDARAWTSLCESDKVLIAMAPSAAKGEVVAALKAALDRLQPPADTSKRKAKPPAGRPRLLCHMCGFVFKDCRYSQHFRRHHRIGAADELKLAKQEMKLFTRMVGTRRADSPGKVLCTICGSRCLHLSLHLKRQHGVSDRLARKQMKDAAVVRRLVSTSSGPKGLVSAGPDSDT